MHCLNNLSIVSLRMNSINTVTKTQDQVDNCLVAIAFSRLAFFICVTIKSNIYARQFQAIL